jgi:hypothetical protein
MLRALAFTQIFFAFREIFTKIIFPFLLKLLDKL